MKDVVYIVYSNRNGRRSIWGIFCVNTMTAKMIRNIISKSFIPIPVLPLLQRPSLPPSPFLSVCRGSAYARRRRERENEMELDERDKMREKDELEELKLQVSLNPRHGLGFPLFVYR